MNPLDPLVNEWFLDRYGPPTPVQLGTWREVALGHHVLATAPTGSGKTLAAFLWPIQQLLTGKWPTGKLRVLYISPLKALAADMERNLQAPLDTLTSRLRAEGLEVPTVRVVLRTGDTTPAERQKLLRKPPEILATTPESLELLLLSERGREILADVQFVVLDEIHDVAKSRRGTLLMACVEQLADLAGDPQRVALSATVRPLPLIAQFMGGWLQNGEPRPVQIVAPKAHKKLLLTVQDPAWQAQQSGEMPPGEAGIWPPIAEACRQIAWKHRTTLIFTGSRRSAERLARIMQNDSEQPWVAAHHGSLSKPIRRSVEQRLARGELRAVVATSSLELGIDIGELDEVVLLGAPRSAASAIQRVGRAGHQVGATSHGTLMPLHAVDTLVATVLVPLVQNGQTEAIVPIEAPLDVLTQLILLLCVIQPRLPEELHDFLRRIAPYHELTRPDLDGVVAMLRGEFSALARPTLQPRLDVDGTGRLVARAGVRRLVAESGGVIPDRGYLQARVAGTGAKLGELDEEFVWERRVGDEFSIGAQTWRIERILDDAVEVVPGSGGRPMTPFWRSEEEAMPAALAQDLAKLLQKLDQPRVEWPDLPELDEASLERLQDLVTRQKRATRGLPHARRVVIEVCPAPTQHNTPDAPATEQVIVHAPWGGMALRPWGMALAAAAERDRGETWRVTTTDLCVGIAAPCTPQEIADQLQKVTADRIEPLLRETLGQSGLFGARFREAAGRSLLLPRRPNKRIPLWLTRQRAKQLLHDVSQVPDFPLIQDVWRTCLQEWMDLPELQAQLDLLHTGATRVDIVRTAKASPLAEGLVWSAVNSAMYDDDVPQDRVPLGEQAVRQGARETELRVNPAVLAALQGRLMRTLPGWLPLDLADARAWLLDRVLVRAEVWADLHARATQEGATWPLDLQGELTPVRSGVTRKDRLEAILDPHNLPQLLQQQLANQGPLQPGELAKLWQVTEPELAELLQPALLRGDVLLRPLLTDDETRFWVTDAHVQRLLRMARAARRPQIEAMPLSRWPAWRAQWQGLGQPAAEEQGPEAVEHALRPLFGLPLPAGLWEADVLPARVAEYQPAWLDALTQATDLMWLGQAGEKIAFLPRQALELFLEPAEENLAHLLLPDPGAQYSAEAVGKKLGRSPAEVVRELWLLAFQGQVTNDSVQALRQGLLTDFAPQPEPPRHRSLGRAGGQVRLHPGTWSVTQAQPPVDALDAGERDKERVRQLAERHGILFREALTHEPPLLGWGRLLPAMRGLELAGELVAGNFIQEIQGLQMALPRALDAIRAPLLERPFWHAAQDPASACGLDVPGLRGWLPSRLTGTRLLWHGQSLVAVVKRSGTVLEPLVPPDDSRLAEALRLFLQRTTRSQSRSHGWVLSQIGEENASASPYRKLLEVLGFHAELRDLAWRRWG